MIRIGLISVVVFFFSCSNEQGTFCSPDNKQCITYKIKGDFLFVFEGNLRNEFVKFDISKTQYDAQALFVCWENENYKLEVICPMSSIVENKFDTTQYRIMDHHETYGEYNLPNTIKFHKEGCFEFGIETKGIYPKENAILN